MKIRSFVLIPGLLILLALTASGQKPDKDKKIRSVIVYQEKYDNLVSKRFKDLEQYYDSRGNLLEEITYKQGKISTHFKYEYDPDDNKIREEEFDQSGKMIEFSEYTYENGLRVEKTVYYPNRKIKSKKIYQYTTF